MAWASSVDSDELDTLLLSHSQKVIAHLFNAMKSFQSIQICRVFLKHRIIHGICLVVLRSGLKHEAAEAEDAGGVGEAGSEHGRADFCLFEVASVNA